MEDGIGVVQWTMGSWQDIAAVATLVVAVAVVLLLAAYGPGARRE